MSNINLLNNETHKDLRVITTRSSDLGDGVMWCSTFSSEFRHVQTYYPILFQEDVATHKLFPIALFGFEEGENLYLEEDGWKAGYIPLMIQRLPFSIGLYPPSDNSSEPRRLINIDISHPRTSNTEGERLFGVHGEQTPYLNRISSMLETIHIWNGETENFISALHEHDLIEPVTMDITLSDGSKGQLIGFYSINEERLAELEINALESLHKKGHLQAIYMAIASLTNISRLIEKKSTVRTSKTFG